MKPNSRKMPVVDTNNLVNMNTFEVKCVTPYATDAEIPGPLSPGPLNFFMVTPNVLSIIAVVSVCTSKKMCISSTCTEQRVSEDSEVHRSLQNCESFKSPFCRREYGSCSWILENLRIPALCVYFIIFIRVIRSVFLQHY